MAVLAGAVQRAAKVNRSGVARMNADQAPPAIEGLGDEALARVAFEADPRSNATVNWEKADEDHGPRFREEYRLMAAAVRDEVLRVLAEPLPVAVQAAADAQERLRAVVDAARGLEQVLSEATPPVTGDARWQPRREALRAELRALDDVGARPSDT